MSRRPRIRGSTAPARERVGDGARLGKDRATRLEEHQEIGRAVLIDVDEGAGMLARQRIEVFDEVDPIVEVARRLAARERAVRVVLVDVGLAVEVGVDGSLDELAVDVVHPPDVGPAVAVAVLGADRAGGRRSDRPATSEQTPSDAKANALERTSVHLDAAE